ncbi:hypothetical protein DES49_2476 [Halospina denitrificans]|uniref:Toxin CptA n=1 Tax=Halospina denitrificans TaxID=332522 RepID=A0A4R7JP27_9GAMM|nr:hypothetical protein [Halospina denitrificans]TDT38499.1 hypothetical protein DES49_2476 [Halospina denitrificans]
MFSRVDLEVGAAPGIGVIAAAPWTIPAILFFAGTTHYVWLAVPAVGCVWASALAFLRQGLLRGSRTLSGIEVRGDSLWILTNTGARHPARVAPESRIAHRWLWLRLDDGCRNHTLLLSDRPGFRNTDPASLRRLTAWLRYCQPERNDTQRPAFR